MNVRCECSSQIEDSFLSCRVQNIISHFPENLKSSKIKNESQSNAGTLELAATMVDLRLDYEKIGLQISEKKFYTVFSSRFATSSIDSNADKEKTKI